MDAPRIIDTLSSRLKDHGVLDLLLYNGSRRVILISTSGLTYSRYIVHQFGLSVAFNSGLHKP